MISPPHKIIPIAVVLVFILTAAVAFYPLVSIALAERNRSIVRTEYAELIEQADDAKLETILAAAQEYNAALTGAFVPERGAKGYYLTATLTDGIYYVTGHVETESEATHFIPMDDGSLVIKGAEDDAYILTEVRTDNRYTLLKGDIHVTISTAEADTCNCYADTLGVTQNDSRYAHIQKHLEHKLLTASATVDENAVTMLPDTESPNALAPLAVVNTRGFDPPKPAATATGSTPRLVSR